MTITVTSLYRYPVKSLGGHSLKTSRVEELGMPGDRCWTLKDEVRNTIKGGKRFPSYMSMSATLDVEPDAAHHSPPVTITLADGTRLNSGDADINQRLTRAIGSPVSLWPLLPKEQLDHYRRPAPRQEVDQRSALRETFARLPDEPLPNLAGFPAELSKYESPPGTYFDAFPLLIISNSALAALSELNTESIFDVRRFRPNIVVDTLEQGFPEDAWAGRNGRIGSAVLKFEMACPRCVMTTHGFAELPKDPGIMRALVGANNGNLGVYASVTQAGVITVGDKLRLT